MDLHGKHIHFMGMGGIGVSGLAGLALAAGAKVSGCDRNTNEQTDRLEKKGAEFLIGHSPAHLRNTDLLVHTSAIPPSNNELVEAGEKAVKRGAFLATLMSGNHGIGICGTHGKTTTTWMTAHILIENNIDPTVILGGTAAPLQGNYRAGGNVFLAELDESDGSFLLPEIETAVITNIEAEHLAHYRTLDKVVEAFKGFSDNIIENGLLICCLDDKLSHNVYLEHKGRKLGYGLQNRSALHVTDIECKDGRQQGILNNGSVCLGEISIPFSGQYNMLNAMAAYSVATEYGVKTEDALASLSLCPGVGRRMELLGEICGTPVYSDYAHHPTEVYAALKGAKERFGNNIMVAFQPHLYSRTRDCADDFSKALTEAAKVILADIYPAREEPIPGVTSGIIADGMHKLGHEFSGPYSLEHTIESVTAEAGDFEAVIFMGAGDIDLAARKAVCSE